MPSNPRALHITFGAYGMRLHGDPRGTVIRSLNHPTDPILGRDEDWQQEELDRLRFDPVTLTDPQRAVAEQLLPSICDKTRCTCHINAVRPDHVHILLTPAQCVDELSPALSEHDAKTIRRLIKRRLSVGLSQRWPLPPGANWWAECGSIKWVWDAQYFTNVLNYIKRQRLT
ncbi:hypothetical protein HED60_15735 [Planctomycetales bacterium ZRK34]|nr:hypothetical protein HED60_15735 [Planctomycetales bacterium ZRK34]